MRFNKNNKTKFIVIVSIITSIFAIIGMFMFFKLVYNNKDKFNIKKDIKTAKKAQLNTSNQSLQIKVVGNEKKENELKKFADKYKEEYITNKNSVNSTPESSAENGEFYIDNAGELYTQNITTLDDRFRIENRLKEAANDMKNVYSETISFNNDTNKLEEYLSKGDNKSRFSYLYGISDENTLKLFICKLTFLKDSKVDCGVLSNIKKVDNNNITFQFQIKTKEGTSQSFNVSINFTDERAILNIKIS